MGQQIHWHGTWKEQADAILREGFAPNTHFAMHMEDALAFGGPFVFEVWFDFKSVDWQFVSDSVIPPDRIKSLTKFQSEVLHGQNDYRSHRYEEFGQA